MEVIANDIFNTEEEAFVDQNFNESFKEFALKVPNFSPVWISSFGRRNRFSWRIAHYARRGSIDYNYVAKYITYVASAIALYGENLVFNIDETSCRINNGSKRSLAPITWEEVVVDARRNSKECFTVIGTCSLVEKNRSLYLPKEQQKHQKVNLEQEMVLRSGSLKTSRAG